MRTEVFIQYITSDNRDDAMEEADKLAQEILTWPEVDVVSVKLESLDDGAN